jgi:hypothetical protein
MTVWQKPSFEELAMNAEIGAYQAEEDGDRWNDVPFLNRSEQPATLSSAKSTTRG